MGQRTGSAPALVRQPAKPNQRIRRRTMSQRDFFPIACLLRSRMPSADRYFLCLPKLVRQLKSSAPARARISRLHYVFFLADCFAQQKQNEPQKARMGSQKGTKNRFCAFSASFCAFVTFPDLGKAPLPKYLHLPVPVRGWLGSGPNSGGGRRCFVARS